MTTLFTSFNRVGRSGIVTGTCFVIFCLSAVGVMSVVIPALAEGRGWSMGQLAWIYPVFQTMQVLTGLFAGSLSDRIGPRRVILTGGFIYGLAWILTGFASSVPMLYFTFCVMGGIGNGFAYSPALSTAQRWCPDRRGAVSGLLVAVANVATALASILAASLLIPTVGAGATFQILGLVFLLFTCTGALLTRNPEPGWMPAGYQPPEGKSSAAGVYGDLTPKQMLKTRRFYFLFVIYACASTAGAMMIGSSSLIARTQLFADPSSPAAIAAGGLVVSITTIAGACGSFLGGALFDRIGGHRCLVLIFGATMCALIGLSLAPTLGLYLGAIVVLGCANGSLGAMYTPFTGRTFGTTYLGSNWALMYWGYAVATWVSAPLSTALYDPSAGRWAYQGTFYGAALISLVGFVLTLYLMMAQRLYNAARRVVSILRVETWTKEQADDDAPTLRAGLRRAGSKILEAGEKVRDAGDKLLDVAMPHRNETEEERTLRKQRIAERKAERSDRTNRYMETLRPPLSLEAQEKLGKINRFRDLMRDIDARTQAHAEAGDRGADWHDSALDSDSLTSRSWGEEEWTLGDFQDGIWRESSWYRDLLVGQDA